MKVADVLDAIEKNGLEKVKGEFLIYDNTDKVGVPKAGCAFGQAGWNLGVDYNELTEAISSLYIDLLMGDGIEGWSDDKEGLVDYIINLNDTTDLTLQEIADKARVEYNFLLDKELEELGPYDYIKNKFELGVATPALVVEEDDDGDDW